MTIAYSSPVWKMIDTMRLAGYDVTLKFDRIGHGRTGLVSCSVYVQDDRGILNEFIEKIRETTIGSVTDAYNAWKKMRTFNVLGEGG